MLFLILTLCIVDIAGQVVPYKEKFFQQNIDHFNHYWQQYGIQHFKQRYLVQDKWWTEGSGPIFFYAGNEGDITDFWDNIGFMFDIAPRFNALVLFAEHRYYGKSLPFGPTKSFTHPYVDLLTQEQALADYAVLLTYLKTALNATKCPVIAFGGSYGGMLAAYMRFKYPNIIDGSISASAPILLISGVVERKFFFKDTTQDFKNAIPGCDDQARDAFRKMDDIVRTGNDGLKSISSTFNLCKPLTSMDEYRHLQGWIRNSFTNLAMFDYPYETDMLAQLPGNPVKVACEKLQNSDVVKGLAQAAGLFYGNPKCYDIFMDFIPCADPTGCGTGPNGMAWDYQACTEVIAPAGSDNVTDMFPVLPFTLEQRTKYCQERWNITPDNDWTRINFWGKDIQTASNIVFSNGDLDPWHNGGVLQNVSDTVLAVMIEGGAHHFDLRGSNPKDNDSVKHARQFHISQIKRWITQAAERLNVLYL